MIRTVLVTNVARTASKLCSKVTQKDAKLVESILKDIQRYDDDAIRKYEKRFNGTDLKSLKVSKKEIATAITSITKEESKAIRLAKARLEKTESAVKSILKIRPIFIDGIKIIKRFQPIENVGCYVPGGLARYPSSAVMSVTPAKIAGVKRIVVMSPTDPEGNIDSLTVAAASICGATEIYKVGGIQAVAALAVGTKSIPKVDKIVGPGGAFVTLTKSIINRQTAIDMLAGPTELGIVADKSANPKHIALDLISQAEHSKDTQCYLITDSPQLVKAVKSQLASMIKNIKRKDIVMQSLKNNGFAAVCKSQEDMTKLADRLAPEHLQIMTAEPKNIASKITSPGIILLGKQSPSSASDYLLGSNHILPTNGFGRTRGSLSVLDFLKISTEVTASKSALSKISKHMQVLTTAEGLTNHYEAVRGRLQ